MNKKYKNVYNDKRMNILFITRLYSGFEKSLYQKISNNYAQKKQKYNAPILKVVGFTIFMQNSHTTKTVGVFWSGHFT